MKKNILMMFGAAALAMAGVSANAATVNHAGNVLILTNNFGAEFKSFNTDVYLNSSFKVNDSWVVTPELAMNVGVVAAGKSKVSGSFGFFRILASGPVIKKWSEKNTFKFDYRYVAPLDVNNQLAGSYGSIGVRPVLNWAFSEKLSAMVRGMTAIGLHRNGYQVNKPSTPKFTPSSYKGIDGNMLISFAPEFQLGYDFSEKFGIYTYWTPVFGLKAPTKGAEDTSTVKFLIHQHAVTYKLTEKIGVDVGIVVEKIPMAKGFKLFSKTDNNYYAEVQYKY